MRRRKFLSASAAASLAASSAPAADEGPANQYFELREYRLRYSRARQRDRLVRFFEQEHLPMCERIGVTSCGYFQVSLGPDTPRLFTVVAYDSLADMQEKLAAMRSDEVWTKAETDFGSGDLPAFDNVESWLLRAFDGMPKIEVPSLEGREKPRFFDLRTYTAETFADVREKINMFNTEEIKIFRKTGINPVFFGETVVGSKMPNLTYMVWYDDMDARMSAWNNFLRDPDWERIRDTPGWSNEEIVSSVSNTFLAPLPFSPIR